MKVPIDGGNAGLEILQMQRENSSLETVCNDDPPAARLWCIL